MPYRNYNKNAGQVSWFSLNSDQRETEAQAVCQQASCLEMEVEEKTRLLAQEQKNQIPRFACMIGLQHTSIIPKSVQ